MPKISHLVLAALASALVAAPACAATWLVNYSSDGSPTAANLTLTVDDTEVAPGTFKVLDISGDVDGDVVTGLIDNPITPAVATSADGLFWYDNLFQPAASPNISWYGLLFSSATHEYNLFSNSPTEFALYKSDYRSYVSSIGTLSVTQSLETNLAGRPGAVPEPSSWALMLTGFGALGAALRANRRRYVPACA
jgi:hypothetical protein